MACSIAYRITQHRGFSVPLVSKPVLRRSLGAKSGSPLEKLTTMKSDKVDFTAKVVRLLLLRLIRLLRRRRLLEWAVVRNSLSLLLGRLLRSVCF